MPAMVHATLIPAIAPEPKPLLVLPFWVGEELEEECVEETLEGDERVVVAMLLLLLEEVTTSFVIFT
jgi:hypothetical protein